MKLAHSWLLLFVFTMTLTGCGGGVDTSGDANDPAVAGGSDEEQMQGETGDVSQQREE